MFPFLSSLSELRFSGPKLLRTILRTSIVVSCFELPTAHGNPLTERPELVGHETCRDCHTEEYATWEQTTHAKRAYQMLVEGSPFFNPKTHKIAARRGVSARVIAKSDTCRKCHNTSHATTSMSLNAVSCEACHGGAGPTADSDGWLDVHSDFGDAFDRADESPEHGQQRLEACEQLGLRHPTQVYDLIRACYECHTVSDPQLLRDGHPVGDVGFEYVRWFQGEVQHGCLTKLDHQDPESYEKRTRRRGLTYVLGQLADVEVNLRRLADDLSANESSTAPSTRVAAAAARLSEVAQRVELEPVDSALNTLALLMPQLFSSPADRGVMSALLAEKADEFEGYARELTKHGVVDAPWSEIVDLIPTGPQTAWVAAASTPSPSRAGGHIVGHDRCAVCHQESVNLWSRSSHARESFDELRNNPNSLTYAENLGISLRDVARDSLCIQCHATPKHNASDRPSVIAGVSCEACHGPAGGPTGWLNRHGAYGPGVSRDNETAEHLQRRHADCDDAGMIRTEHVYELARRCYECHLVRNERLVEVGGHKSGRYDFEWVAWMQRGVRHNFFLDRSRNADVSTIWSRRQSGEPKQRQRVMYLVGQLVDLELSLRSLAMSTGTEFSSTAAGRVMAARQTLTTIASRADLPSVSRLLAELDELAPELFLAQRQPETLTSLADFAAQVAQEMSQQSGEQLSAVDALLPTPE